MRREARVHLWDIEESICEIRAFTQGKKFADYTNDSLLRAAVERKFEIIGEALVRLARQFPQDVDRIEGYRGFIGLRNVIAHQYDDVDDSAVWRDAEESLQSLLDQVTAWRNEADVTDPL